MNNTKKGIDSIDAKIIIALAKNRLRPYAAHQDCLYSRSGFYYRVRKIKDNTGKNPLDFFDMMDLYKMAVETLQAPE